MCLCFLRAIKEHENYLCSGSNHACTCMQQIVFMTNRSIRMLATVSETASLKLPATPDLALRSHSGRAKP